MHSPKRKSVNSTSLHSQILNRTYHYNTILGAKSQIDNANPEKHVIPTLHNKRYKQLHQQRVRQNKKLLTSLIDIDENYRLYNYTQDKKFFSVRNSHFFSTRKKKGESQQKIKSLKNEFKEKMSAMRISEYNTKVYNKMVNIKSYVQGKKQLKKWNKRIDFYESLMKSRQQESQQLNKKFFQTFSKIKKAKAKRSFIQIVNKDQNKIVSNLNIFSHIKEKSN